VSRLTAEDLARNPRLRKAVSAAVARDIAAGTASGTSARPKASTSTCSADGRADTHKCCACEQLHPSYAAAERHADELGHHRIETQCY
jgi:hypothetical protein